MPVLHIANKNYSSWSLRPWLLLKTLGIPFEEKLHRFGEDFGFSPTRRVPCLMDGDTTAWDSLGIVEYLAETNPQVWPLDAQARAWARSATAEMHSGFSELRTVCGMNCGVRVELDPASRERVAADLARIDALWNEGLQRFGGPFLAGDAFTAVDAFYAPVILRLQTYGLQLSPAAMDYAGRVRDLPAMQDWVAAGLVEPWRDQGHDEEIVQFGRITQDLRASEAV